ncbi:MAG: NRDE family protein [Pirellulales bacterium]|nr:NRDE family protein [Pirellulales bacterium]
MCTLAILFRTVRGTPLLVAANREERYDRPTQYPKIQPGTPRVVCGTDRKAGGTWLGINQHGLFCSVLNRPRKRVPMDPRSRGLLCREMLDARTAREAAEYAFRELSSGKYAGGNFVAADPRSAFLVYGGDQLEVIDIPPGLHVVTDGAMDNFRDPRHELVRRMLTLHTLDSAVTFLAVASRAFSRKPDHHGRRGVVIQGQEYGTVSSTLLALSRKIQHAVLQYSPGPPCDHPYADLSALLRQVLSADRSRKSREAAEKAKLLHKGRDGQPAAKQKVKVKKKA